MTGKCLDLDAFKLKFPEKFYCGKLGCPGHLSVTGKCLDLDAFKLKFPGKFYCGKPGCPGHLSVTDRCLDLDAFKLKFPEKFYCGKPGCPGHLSVGDKCLDLNTPINIAQTGSTVKFASPNIQRQESWFQPTSIPQTWSTTKTSSTSSRTNSTVDFIIVLALLSMVCALWVFGVERMLVAAEGFFLFGGWAGLRVAEILGKQEVEKLENYRTFMAIGFGLCGGLLAAYLLLTTSEGQAITEWVTAQTVRIIGSLFVSVIGLGVLELAWRRLSQWVREKAT